MPSPILARADALMQRRRQNTPESEEIPVLTDAIDDDDIPVLLQLDEEPPQAIAESESISPVAVMERVDQEQTPPGIDRNPVQLETLVSELVSRIERRLVAELPGMIESAVRDLLNEQQNPGS